ncbi:hypothetical protein ACLSU7_12870 [Bdellovibrio sp. HCB185ZH]|uniref:hypothetical protein n=1 Tax=Bdellovibrio sp. HCB185ZH TaxID=3394235 RepID=UPI0039A5E29A
MKNSQHREEIKRNIPQEIIKAEKHDSRPTQNHTPDGPAEEYINESRNDSNEPPPFTTKLLTQKKKTSFWDIFKSRKN